MMLNAPNLWLSGIAAITVLAAGLVSAMIDPAPRAAYAQSTCSTEPFFSEYVEGTSNNKAVEIFNGADVPLNLTGYEIVIYSNGSSTPSTTIGLAGIVDPGGVYVVVAQEILGVPADQTVAALNFNGNDAVALQAAGGGPVVDVIGDIGVDPGIEWGSGDTSTADNTLQRLSTVTGGRTATTPDFNTVLPLEWVGFLADTFIGLGSHTAECFSGAESTPGDMGSVVTTINAIDAPGPCLLLSTESIDYGTLAFSTPLTPRVASGEVQITTCNDEPEDILARGADATGTSATWTLADLPFSNNMCDAVDAGNNRYAHTVSDSVAPPISLSDTNQTYQSAAAGGSIISTQTLFGMPCSGSDGAGELMSTSITFTAVASVP